MKEQTKTRLKPRKGKENQNSTPAPEVVGSGRWAACCPLAAAAAAVVPELIFARLSIPGSAVGIMGPTQHHVNAPSQPRDRISTISHTALITGKEMILLSKAAQTINTFTSKGRAVRCPQFMTNSLVWSQVLMSESSTSQRGIWRPFRGMAVGGGTPGLNCPVRRRRWLSTTDVKQCFWCLSGVYDLVMENNTPKIEC